METMKSIMHMVVLAVLGLTAAIGIFSTNMSDLAAFAAWKVVGFAAVYAVCRLYRRWRKKDKWITAYEEFCNS